MNRSIIKARWVLLLTLSAVLLIAMHIPTKNLGGSGLSLLFNVIVLAVFVPGIFVSLYFASTEPEIYINKITKLLFVLVLVMSVPLIWADSLQGPLIRVLALWMGLLFFILLQQNNNDMFRERLVQFIVISALIECFFGLFQLVYFFDSGILEYGSIRRPLGVFQQPNVLGSYIATGIMASGWLVAYGRLRLSVVLYWMMALIGPVLLMMILSRAALIGLSIGLILFLLAPAAKVNLRKLKQWLFGLVVGFVFGFIYIQLGNDGLPRSIESVSEVGARGPIYNHALWMIAEKPIAGWGYGNFEYAYLHSLADRTLSGDSVSDVLRELNHPHNELLLWGIEGGLLVLLPMVFILGYLCVLLFKYCGRKGFLLLSLLAPLAVHSMLEFPFYHSIPHFIIFIILIWLCFGAVGEGRYIKIAHSGAVTILSILFSFLAFVYFSTTYQSSVKLREFYTDPGSNSQAVLEVYNPVALGSKLDVATNQALLAAALDLGDRDLMATVVTDSMEVLDKNPNRILYSLVLFGLVFTDEISKAEEHLAYGKVLYAGKAPFTENATLDDFR